MLLNEFKGLWPVIDSNFCVHESLTNCSLFRPRFIALTSGFCGLGGTRTGKNPIVDVIEDRQDDPVADDPGALVAVIRPVLAGTLQSISTEVVSPFGERDQLPLRLLGRLRKRGDGDCGIAFEYAVHDAVISADPIVVERVAEALNRCRIVRGSPASILFAIEKTGGASAYSNRDKPDY
jgi:hypothetical protein